VKRSWVTQLVLFRFAPLLIIMTTAILWRVAGDKVAITACAILFAADAALLIAIVRRGGKKDD